MKKGKLVIMMNRIPFEKFLAAQMERPAFREAYFGVKRDPLYAIMSMKKYLRLHSKDINDNLRAVLKKELKEFKKKHKK